MSDNLAVPQQRSPSTPQPERGTPAELTARLKELHMQRLADEAEAAQLSILLRAILLTRLDRDAGTAPKLTEHRAHLNGSGSTWKISCARPPG